jgi:hypothetical protein
MNAKAKMGSGFGIWRRLRTLICRRTQATPAPPLPAEPDDVLVQLSLELVKENSRLRERVETYEGIIKAWLVAAICDNATGSSAFDLPTSNAPTKTCFGTSPHRFGTLSFADGANALTSTVSYTLPSDWTGAVDLRFIWFSANAGANGVDWTVATSCIADTEDLIAPGYNAVQNTVDANNGANVRNSATIAGIDMTGCAAGETLYLRLGRDPTNGGDTLAATAELIGIELTVRRAM